MASPAEIQKPEALGALVKSATAVALCGVYIAVSASLIRFNKILMQKDKFPHSMALSSLHMGCSLVLCSLLYLVRPSMFPGMAATEGKRKELFSWFVPIGITFAISLFTSNVAYMYCNVSFLQFMKEGNVIIGFMISCAVGLQVMNRVRLAVICWIVAASMLCVGSEINFVWIGFFVQLTSQFAECARIVLGECVLSGSNFKLDPLTYTLFAAPTCLVVLVIGNVFTWDPQIVPRAMEHWHLLLPNMTLAFVLNLLVATVIKEISAVGFILTGLVKDMVIVGISAVVFGEVVAPIQILGFALVLVGILFWSLMKALPTHPAVRAVEDFMGLPRPEEEKPILSAKEV